MIPHDLPRRIAALPRDQRGYPVICGDVLGRHFAFVIGPTRKSGTPSIQATNQGTGIESGVLFFMGEPTECLWYAEGRPATRAECLASIESGLPLLMEPAADQGADAVAELERMKAVALRHLPTEGGAR